MEDHEKYMERCFELAENGSSNVAPNPLVAAVLVKDGKIIGEGFHTEYGKAHAEVNAIQAVEDKDILKEATLYVNLEPCSHYGKTPPCADLIIESGIKKVVIANNDPNPKVNGEGIRLLRENNIEVITGVLAERGKYINRHFFTFHEKQRPFVLLKWAQTGNGFMDIERDSQGKAKEDNHISCKAIDRWVHLQRSRHQAILVGKNTVFNDNPQLNLRYVEGKDPIKIVLDSHLALNPKKYQLFDNKNSVIVFNKEKEAEEGNIRYLKADTLKDMLDKLYDKKIQSILVEGGRKVLESFIQGNYWDEAKVIVGEKYFPSGLKAPEMCEKPDATTNYFDDKILFYKNKNNK